jgi:tRNA 2-thiouridine synthesizing protein E
MNQKSMPALTLTEDHLIVIKLLQAFYAEYETHPSLRILIKLLENQAKWPKDKACSLYLHKLFPDGPLKQASQLGGLPKPLKCI